MLPLAAYAERLSARPGSTLRFHVANATGADVHAAVHRVLCADPNPAIGGVMTEVVPLEVVTIAPAQAQRVPLGSFARLGPEGMLAELAACTLSLRLMPTLHLARRQVVVSTLDAPSMRSASPEPAAFPAPDASPALDPSCSTDASGTGWELSLEQGLLPVLSLAIGTLRWTLRSSCALHANVWHEIALIIDTVQAQATLCHRRHLPGAQPQPMHSTTLRLPAPPADCAHSLPQAAFRLQSRTRRMSLASASHLAPVDCFNGRIEQPTLWSQALSPAQALDLCSTAQALFWSEAQGPSTRSPSGCPDPSVRPDPCSPRDEDNRHQPLEGSCLACWDFTGQMHSQLVLDIGPHGHHGELVNTPTRAVRSAAWNGSEHCFRHAPAHYAAIHFHDDDLDDCRWPATHQIHIPTDLASGAYALMLHAASHTENVPFFVVPPKGKPGAALAVLVSTFTYTVYGNHARPEWIADPVWRAAYQQQAADWKAYPHNPGEHRDYGLSTYNTHTDGSGIALVSWRRPMLNLRIGYFTYPYPAIRGSGLRHYPADSHLLLWLARKGIAADLITDAELQEEGRDLLRHYKVIVTGTHPEYHTAAMLDALQAYRDSGGKLAYLGGNGFYWKIALDPTREGVIEVRRAEGGIRAWAAEPGEYYQQFDGSYGGLWRRNARPPQQLVGVGFTAQGNFNGSPYRIRPEIRSNREAGWIVEGVDEDLIGDAGFSGHGAAGFELDRMDHRLGTPANALVIASSENHPADAPWILVPEEQLTHITTLAGQPARDLIRADMCYFKVAGGGEVFSAGSITFCGSLMVNSGHNPISRILENVVRRFLHHPGVLLPSPAPSP